jgi:hypothetical protein
MMRKENHSLEADTLGLGADLGQIVSVNRVVGNFQFILLASTIVRDGQGVGTLFFLRAEREKEKI